MLGYDEANVVAYVKVGPMHNEIRYAYVRC
jgi:hypothetical protein